MAYLAVFIGAAIFMTVMAFIMVIMLNKIDDTELKEPPFYKTFFDRLMIKK